MCEENKWDEQKKKCGGERYLGYMVPGILLVASRETIVEPGATPRQRRPGVVAYPVLITDTAASKGPANHPWSLIATPRAHRFPVGAIHSFAEGNMPRILTGVRTCIGILLQVSVGRKADDAHHVGRAPIAPKASMIWSDTPRV